MSHVHLLATLTGTATGTARSRDSGVEGFGFVEVPGSGLATSYRPARRGSLALEDDQGMPPISGGAQEIAGSRQGSIPADEGKPWRAVRLDGERGAGGGGVLPGCPRRG